MKRQSTILNLIVRMFVYAYHETIYNYVYLKVTFQQEQVLHVNLAKGAHFLS